MAAPVARRLPGPADSCSGQGGSCSSPLKECRPLLAAFLPGRAAVDTNLPAPFPPPRSYAAILGGLCTIIGTSTNLIVRGLAMNDFKDLRFGFFEISER